MQNVKIDFVPIAQNSQKIDFVANPDVVPSVPKLPASKTSILGDIGNYLKSVGNDVVGGLDKASSSTLNDLQSLGGKTVNALNILSPLGAVVQGAAKQGAKTIGDPNSFTYKASDFLGNTIPFVMGGEGLDAARGAAEALPFIGKGAEWLGGSGLAGVSRRALGAAAYGGLTNPGNRLKGAEIGAVASPVADIIPGLAKGGKFLTQGIKDWISPDAAVKNIVQYLGSGQNRENAGQYVAKAIKNTYAKHKSQANVLYNRVSNLVSPNGNNRLTFSTFKKLPGEVLQNILQDSDIRSVASELSKNPTFNNAINLRGQLQSEISALTPANSVGDSASRALIKHYQKGLDALDQDLDINLNRAGPEAEQAYSTAKSYFRKNVIPYRENSSIFKMATGRLTNPTNIHNVFSLPEPSTLKVLKDLPTEAKNRIMLSRLGKINTVTKPEKLAKEYDNAINDGLETSMTPKLHSLMSHLQSTIKRRNDFDQGAGLATGLLLGSHVNPEWGTIAGGYVGNAIAKPLAKGTRAILRTLPAKKSAQAITTAYKPSAKAVLANLIGGQYQ